MEVNQSAASSIAERIILPMKRHLVVNFSVTLGVQHTLIHETFLLLIQLFPPKSRRMSNPLHDVKVTWFNLMCPKHKILPNLYIYMQKRVDDQPDENDSLMVAKGSKVSLTFYPLKQADFRL